MSKSILIIDTPKSCYKCPMMFDDGNGIWCGVERDKDGDMHMRVHYYCDENGRAIWCPLRPLPQARDEHCRYDDWDLECLINAENRGFNKCLHEILGETK